MSYCEIDAVKERLLIKETDDTFDDAIESAITEACSTIDMFLTPYEETLPLEEVPEMIGYIAADFASSIFKRRWIPEEAKIRGTLQPDMINDIDGTGWFALGLKRLMDYIKNIYALAETQENSVYNPDNYMLLFKSGIITLKEARALMNNPTSIINSRIDNITKTSSMTEEITRIVNDTKVKYHTDKQKSFVFVESDPDSFTAYKKQDDEEEE